MTDQVQFFPDEIAGTFTSVRLAEILLLDYLNPNTQRYVGIDDLQIQF